MFQDHQAYFITILHRRLSFVQQDISGLKVIRITSRSMKVRSIRVNWKIHRNIRIQSFGDFVLYVRFIKRTLSLKCFSFIYQINNTRVSSLLDYNR